LVCSVNCIYRTRCDDFALFYDDHKREVDELVTSYLKLRRDRPSEAQTTLESTASLITLEVKRNMAEGSFVWIGEDDRAELLEMGEIILRAERGEKAKHIFKVAQEMEFRFQLVPRKKIEKAKRAAAADNARVVARQRAGRAEAEEPEEAPRIRRARTRAAGSDD
jgi:hypothetical protein